MAWPVGLIISILYLVIAFIKEKNTKPIPPNAKYDQDLYWEDFRNGVPQSVINHKLKTNAYWVVPEEESEAEK